MSLYYGFTLSPPSRVPKPFLIAPHRWREKEAILTEEVPGGDKHKGADTGASLLLSSPHGSRFSEGAPDTVVEWSD